MVRRPLRFARSAAAMISLISLIPDSTALNGMKSDFVILAMICASVVFPTPGGPHRIIDGTWSCSIAVRRGFPGSRRWPCPTISSSVSGRIRSARGPDDDAAAGIARSSSSNSDPLMFRCLVKDDRDGDRRIQRFDDPILWHAEDNVALPKFLVRRAGALVADQDRRRPLPIPHLDAFISARRRADQRDAGGFQFFV